MSIGDLRTICIEILTPSSVKEKTISVIQKRLFTATYVNLNTFIEDCVNEIWDREPVLGQVIQQGKETSRTEIRNAMNRFLQYQRTYDNNIKFLAADLLRR